MEEALSLGAFQRLEVPMNTFARTFAAALMAVSAAGIAAPAMAAGPAETETLKIDRAALADPAYAGAVIEKIERTAQKVCRQENAHGAMSDRGLRICMADTVERTVAEIGSPALARALEGRAAPMRLASHAADGAR